MANPVDNLGMSCHGGSSLETSVSSSYGIDMVALTGMFRNGSEIEIPLSGKSGQGEQAGSAGLSENSHGGVMWD